MLLAVGGVLRAAVGGPLVLLVALLVPLRAQAQGGPDAFGYTWDGAVYDYIPLTGFGADLGLYNDEEVAVPLPFPFDFYGTTYEWVTVADNGGLVFGTLGGVDSYSVCLPSGAYAGPDVAIYWEDLDSGSGLASGVLTWHDVPGDRFIISWEQIPLTNYSSGGEGSFQIHLHPDGRIEFHWADTEWGWSSVDHGGFAVIGIQDPAGLPDQFLQYSCEQASVVDGTAITFLPPTWCVDADGDGWTDEGCGGDDCDDSDPAISPDAQDVCNGLDDDCDPVTDEATDVDGDGYSACAGDCDDSNSLLSPATDNDLDGFDACSDCNDWSPVAYPGAPEYCDGIDSDCAGDVASTEADDDSDGWRVCMGDCDDADPANFPAALEQCDGADNDCDGVAGADAAGEVDADGDGSLSCADCDDADPSNSPDAAEACDGSDNDCDGAPSADPAGEVDDDGDGSLSCVDCDDSDPLNFPTNVETCDGVDNDCDGLIDTFVTAWQGGGLGQVISDSGPQPSVAAEVVITTPSVVLDVDVSLDVDHPFPIDLLVQLVSPLGTTIDLSAHNGWPGADFSGTVFDDEAPFSITAGAPPFTGPHQPQEPLSAFDGEPAVGTWFLLVSDLWFSGDGLLLDWELHVLTDETYDSDGDGFSACMDCADDDPSIWPGATELCDGQDTDCDGWPDADPAGEVDADGDGSLSCADCDDADPLVYPGRPEACDGLDNDCDPTTQEGLDSDGDGLSACAGDCNDLVSTVYPGATELCDGLDGDCDGTLPADEEDLDGDGSVGCLDCDDADPANLPGGVEACDGADNDCDGAPDADTAGEVDGDGDGVLSCLDCLDDDPAVRPGAMEVCNGLDDNCDGVLPAWDVDGDGDGAPTCTDCEDADAMIFPGQAEICDNVDNDCDGHVDEVEALVVGEGAGSVISFSVGWPDLEALAFVPGDGPLLDADVQISISHAWVGDLTLVLESPDGTPVLLADAEGWDGLGYDGTWFDDEAEQSIEWQIAPFAGDFRPETPLSDLDGEPVWGLWALAIDDSHPASDGVLLGWALELTYGGQLDVDGDGWAGCDECDDADPAVHPAAGEVCDGLDTDCDPSTEPTGGEEDVDGDGYPACDDCDDGDAQVHPGVAEACDGLDNDCDPATDEGIDADGDGQSTCDGDCDDGDPLVFLAAPEACDGLDGDCDGLPNADAEGEADTDGDGSLSCDDCNDLDASIHPGATELCDGLDNDCDPSTHELLDGDADGQTACDGDCDDTNASVFWGGAELCDGLDTDCNGFADLDLAGEVDTDGDGALSCEDCNDNDPDISPLLPEACDILDTDCDPSTSEDVDSDGDGLTACDGDCNDLDPGTFPGAPEVCDGEDNDCDGVAGLDPTDEVDADGDGSPSCEDCDDADPARAPWFLEQCDGLDNDCEPATDEAVDFDGDGLSACEGDCDDTDPEAWPGAPETCTGSDTDCDGTDADEDLDEDLDGVTPCEGDCDDRSSSIQIGADEQCDGLDGDCDGVVPEDEVDGDGDGWRLCDGDCDDGAAEIWPGAPEICDGVDSDCDGEPDDDIEDGDGDGLSPCEGDCDDTNPLVYPGRDEACDGLDNDCDGFVSSLEADQDEDGSLLCGGDCDDRNPARHPDHAELCDDLLDNDCDDLTDEWDPDCDDPGDVGEDLGPAPPTAVDDELLDAGPACACGSRIGGPGARGGGGWLLALVATPLLLLRRRRRASTPAVPSMTVALLAGLAALPGCLPAGQEDGVVGDVQLTTSLFDVGPGLWRGQPNQVGAEVGAAVQGVGDVDGDGFEDVAVGAPGFSDGEAGEGVVLLFPGGPSGVQGAPTWSFQGDSVDAQAGAALAGLGDVDGDGLADLAVGAPGYPGAAGDAGAVLIFAGTGAGLAATPTWVIEGPADGAAFGASVAWAGDVDGDGYCDLLAGAPQADGAAGGEGVAQLFSGSASGPSTLPVWTVWGDQPGGHLGAAVGSGGDVTGDGWADLLVGSPDRDGVHENGGRLELFTGSASGPGSSPAWSVDGDGDGERLGAAVAGVGDVDGDGFTDVLVGSPGWEGGSGRVSLFLGALGAPAATPGWTSQGQAPGDELGFAVSAAGDINGDGLADFAVGAPGADTAAIDGGDWWVYLGGGGAGLLAEVVLAGRGDVGGAGLGRALGSGGDVEGDGFGSLLVGAQGFSSFEATEGAFQVWPGFAWTPNETPATIYLESDQVGAGRGEVIEGAGDVDGDGYDDLLVGEPAWSGVFDSQGRVLLFPGGLYGPEPMAAWVATGSQADEGLGSSVTAGDFNGDGYSDIATGAPGWSGGSAGEGAVHQFLGSSAGPEPTASWTAGGGQPGAALGSSMSGGVDVSADGYPDLLVGAPDFQDTHTDEGGAFLFLGSAGGLVAPAVSTFAGVDEENAHFGSSVALLGDVNGDGIGDLAISAPDSGYDPYDAGHVWVWHGGPGGPAAAPDWGLGGSDLGAGAVQAHLGTLGRLGDQDGDGFSDLLVGAPGWSSTFWDSGRMDLFLGSSSGLEGTPAWTEILDLEEVGLGATWTAAGDSDGDGPPDIFVGTPDLGYGWILAFAGSGTTEPMGPILMIGGTSAEEGIGVAVAGTGDLNGDGMNDLAWGLPGLGAGLVGVGLSNDDWGTGAVSSPVARAVQPGGSPPISPWARSTTPDSFEVLLDGRSPFGRLPMQLQVEVKEAAVPFDGAGLIESTWREACSAGLACDPSFDFALAVTGLAADTAHHWRARVRFHPSGAPPQGWTRWSYGGHWTDAQGVHLRTGCASDIDGDALCDGIDPDADGDGFGLADGDCDDLAPLTFPGAAELADDGIDQDCNGADLVTCFEDADLDGFGGIGSTEAPDGDCTDDPGEAAASDDCDDFAPESYPGATELCDGRDQDCDGVVPAGEIDDDGDGWVECEAPSEDHPGQPQGGGDCDDLDAGVHPGVSEIEGDGIDQDCNGTDSVSCWLDGDGDGYGSGSIVIEEDGACEPPHLVASGDDCNDLHPGIYPGAVEQCDVQDSDCDGDLVDEDPDSDGDGWPDCVDEDDDGDGAADTVDCLPLDPSAAPGFPEACDGIDTDCDPQTDEDTDHDLDGWSVCGGDCDDVHAGVHPGQPEQCDEARVDSDCDPTTDERVDGDGDGWTICWGDCDDTDDETWPGAEEFCDPTDQDCDGDVLENFEDLDRDDVPDCGSVVIPIGPGCLSSCGVASAGRPVSAAFLFGLLGMAAVRRRARAKERKGRRPGPCACLLGLALLVAAPTPAAAQPRDAQLAVEAYRLWSGLCEGLPDGESASPEDQETLRDALDRLDRATAVGRSSHLDYWRALLNECLGDSAAAIEGFDRFLEGHADGDTLQQLVVDARERRSRLAGTPEEVGGRPTARPKRGPRGTETEERPEGSPAEEPGTSSAPSTEGPEPPEEAEEALAPTEAALHAHEIHETHCAELAGGKLTVASGALLVVGEAWHEVGRALEETGELYLAYWRGVLGQCLGRTDAAIEDLKVFVYSLGESPAFEAQADDATRRLRLMGVATTDEAVASWGGVVRDYSHLQPEFLPGVARARAWRPVVLLAVGGGYQRAWTWNYGAMAAELSLRLKGTLRLEIGVRVGVGEPLRDPFGDVILPQRRPILTVLQVGPVFRFDGPVNPRVGLAFQIAPNPDGSPGAVVLPGFAARAGLSIPLGRSRVAFRPEAEVGLLGPVLSLRGLAWLEVGI